MPESDEMLELARSLLGAAMLLIAERAPAVRDALLDVTEAVFCARAAARQLALAVALETGALTLEQVKRVLHAVSSNFSSRSRLIRRLLREQESARTQDEWMDLAERIDSIQGNDAWRSEPDCPLYESDRISARVDEFVHLMRRRDIFDLMFTLRGGVARNKFGLLHEGLFSRAMAGSKVLVETYHNVVCTALDFVCDAPVLPGDEPIPTEARLAFFNETRHQYGRTALLLSGGAALGFYHVGVVRALMLNGLLPRVIGGASAGSILCSMVATRTDEECVRDLFEVRGTVAHGHSGTLKLNFFRPHDYVRKQAEREELQRRRSQREGDFGEVLHNTAGAFHDAKLTWQIFVPIGLRQFTSFLYDVLTGHRRPSEMLKSDTEHFRSCCRANIGNFTFQEAFDRTGRILNIIVTPQNRSDPPRLLNYLTAPHVLVWSAAVASSSLPGVFEPNKLLVKDADGTERYESASAMRFLDGSMEADLPMQQLSEMFNVNHFIISQANPHAVLLASFNVNKSVWTNRIVGLAHGVLLFLKNQVKAWFRHAVELVGGRRVAPLWDTRRGVASQIFTQEYEGKDTDISLIPWGGHRSIFSAFLHCLYNPSTDDFHEWSEAAERETWRYIPKIKSHVAEEMTLDRCVQRLRQRLMMESRTQASGSGSGLPAATTAGDKMGMRVPSFFTSPSLVNLGGLGVGDPYNLQSSAAGAGAGGNQPQEVGGRDRPSSSSAARADPPSPAVAPAPPPFPPVELRPGWGGMGLRGNHSYASLTRAGNSVGSGLFLDDESSVGGGGAADDRSSLGGAVGGVGAEAGAGARRGEQAAGEVPRGLGRGGASWSGTWAGGWHGSLSSLPDLERGGGYVKTTTMANFYYRKTQSHGNLNEESLSSGS